MDTEEAAAELAGRDVNRECDRATFAVLHQLQTVNLHVQAYRLIDEVAREEEQRAIEAQRLQRPVRMVFCQLNSDDHRQYNVATAKEVAVVYVGSDEEIPGEGYVVVYERGQGLRTISYLNRLCDPLSYPILLPRGEDGWHPDMEKTVAGNNRRTRVTEKEFYSYLLFARTGTFNPLLHAGKLSQQYVVGSWLKIGMNHLNYLRKNQKELRLDTVRGLHDYMIGDDTHDGPPGRRIIPAAIFTGGPRHMIAQYQDAMSNVSNYGKPDIFLTFTCSSNWREIQNNLAGGQSASNRPDLVTLVFNLKLKALCHELLPKNVLGEVVAYIYVAEFQKRGFPHVHMLLTTKQKWKLNNADQIDQLISAELPDPDSDPELFDIVSKNMIHRPCGNLNPTSPCMRDVVCTKRFPKSFRSDTSLNVDGYPDYKRRDDERYVTCRGVRMDNRSVVPYCAYLTRMFEAHTNVGICALIHAVKYLFKYGYKGPDRARIHIYQPNNDAAETVRDEIEAYIDARYVCAPEAVHRILGFKMHGRSDAVQRLQVHLPGFEALTFKAGAVNHKHLMPLKIG
ncbi:unnamed protein product [Heligmosomoides polygyrus]|uniref:Helitron_like_N domain-containing protein n=1 Tax=Heligmosomoides polygyrus TaxID=6339 RepID=A0A183GEI5_HELPZ|nr:unnamed protein product [Heligmosomoides polygyrus]